MSEIWIKYGKPHPYGQGWVSYKRGGELPALNHCICISVSFLKTDAKIDVWIWMKL